MLRWLPVALALLAPLSASAETRWRATLERQMAEMHRAVERYRDVSVAEAEGWRIFGADSPAMGEHWRHPDRRPQSPGQSLDLTRPLNLMYTEIDGRRRLVGVTYAYRLGPGEPMPEGFAGPLDEWHVHNFSSIVAALTEDRPVVRWLGHRWLDRRFAPDGRTRLAMVHVWLDGANPDGPFAMNHRPLAYQRMGLGPTYWRGASREAAFGVALAHPDGCDNALDGRLRVARVDRPRRRALKQACAAAARVVRLALDRPPPVLNRVAETARACLEARKHQVLRPEEKQRIAAMVEHGHEHATAPPPVACPRG